tara:strand:+ start:233 stop:439 length:207 start_codon:yes stop_codon:yes gene_type:complete
MNAWQAHVKKVMAANKGKSLKDCLKMAKKTYTKVATVTKSKTVKKRKTRGKKGKKGRKTRGRKTRGRK